MKTAFSLAVLLAAAPFAAQASPDFFADALPAHGKAFQLLEKDTRAAAPLLLTRNPDGGAAVARVAQGEALQVVFADAQGRYLVKTAFGLTGWAQAGDGGKADGLDQLATRTLKIGGETAYTVHYQAALGKESDKQQADPEDSDVVLHDVLVTPLAEGGKAHIVRCAAGVANDITYCLFPQGDADKAPAVLSGNHFHIPGNGFVYGDYHDKGGSYYRHYSKWQWTDGEFREVEQPYRYIGAEGRATGMLVLNSEAGGGKHVGIVKSGSKVHVILADPHQPCLPEHTLADGAICDSATVLVRDEEGHVGWVNIRYEEGSDTPPATIESEAMGGLVG